MTNNKLYCDEAYMDKYVAFQSKLSLRWFKNITDHFNFNLYDLFQRLQNPYIQPGKVRKSPDTVQVLYKIEYGMIDFYMIIDKQP